MEKERGVQYQSMIFGIDRMQSIQKMALHTILNACHTFHTYHALYGFEAITFSCYRNHYVFTLSIITLPFSELFCSYCEPVSR